jgi:hypothetical protein
MDGSPWGMMAGMKTELYPPLFCIVIVGLVGIGTCAHGLRGIFTGELELFWSTDGTEVPITFVGTRACWMSTMLILHGTGLLTLLYVGPRAWEAHVKRASFFAIPVWQGVLLVLATGVFAIGIVGLVVGTFLGA